MPEPRRLAQFTEDFPAVPPGNEERYSGYGVMGLTFRSGHVLGLRRFAASSSGRGYTSVWHRAPGGEWTFYQDAPPEQSCPRYFGPLLRRSVQCPIEIRWDAPDRFAVLVDGGRAVEWEVALGATAAVRAMNAMASLLPGSLWHSARVLRLMGRMASRMLGAGRISLAGRTPSGQRFIANPLVAWTIPSSTARVAGMDVGELGPLPRQERLGDFWIPQRGLFVIGRAFFEPLDATRHHLDTHAEA